VRNDQRHQSYRICSCRPPSVRWHTAATEG